MPGGNQQLEENKTLKKGSLVEQECLMQFYILPCATGPIDPLIRALSIPSRDSLAEVALPDSDPSAS